MMPTKQYSSSAQFLFITNRPEESTNQLIARILADMGQVSTLAEEASLLPGHPQVSLDVVVVDAAINEPADVVMHFRKLYPQSKIVVVTGLPHWAVARAVLKAGATDYWRKSLDKNDMVRNFKSLLLTPSDEVGL
jgi:ActR/RegA family two-component response regulator